jgi:hypothetical protein
MAAWLAGFTAVVYGACWLDGALWIQGRDVGLLEDIPMALLLVSLLALVVTTVNLFDKLLKLAEALPEAAAADRTDTVEGPLERRMRGELERALAFIAIGTKRARWCFAATLGFATLLFYTFQIHIPLFAVQPVRGWAMIPERFPVAFGAGVVWACFWAVVVLGNVIWYAGSTAVVVFRLVHRSVESGAITIIPVSPDGKGGLSSVGAVSFATTLILASGMPFIVGWILVFGVDLNMMVGFPLYLAALLALFFVPLLAVHRAMQHAKESELARLGLAFRQEYSHLPPLAGLKAGLPPDLQAALRQSTAFLSRLDQLYRRAEMMPVWPFDVTTLARLFSLVVLPLILFLVQKFTENSLTRLLSLN